MITYVDASVLLRIVQGSTDRLETWSETEPISSYLIRVECLRTLDRARLQPGADDLAIGSDRASVLELLQGFSLAPVTSSVLDRAADPFPTMLGSLDAIHLATALELRDSYPDLVFATHDRQLGIAARSLGFLVVGITSD